MTLPCKEGNCIQEGRISKMEERLENFMISQTTQLQEIKEDIKSLSNGGLSSAIQEQNQELVEQLVTLVREERKSQADAADKERETEMERWDKSKKAELEKWKLLAKILGGGFGITLATQLFEWAGRFIGGG